MNFTQYKLSVLKLVFGHQLSMFRKDRQTEARRQNLEGMHRESTLFLWYSLWRLPIIRSKRVEDPCSILIVHPCKRDELVLQGQLQPRGYTAAPFILFLVLYFHNEWAT